MELFADLDVSLGETRICVVDEGGRIIRQARAPSEPRALARAIRLKGRRIEHVGLEAGPLSQWLHEALEREGLDISIMLNHGGAPRPSADPAMRVKPHRHDARGLARLVRRGRFERVRVKPLDAQEARALRAPARSCRRRRRRARVAPRPDPSG